MARNFYKMVLFHGVIACIGLLGRSPAQGATLPLSCYQPAEVGCDFYSHCLEEKVQCGETGYALSYAKKYCELFSGLEGLSDAGKQWRDGTLRCLQQQLYPVLDATWPQSCEGVKVFAYRTHPTCYTMPGNSICMLPASDWKLIAKMFRANARRSEVNWDSFRQMGQMLRNCISDARMNKRLKRRPQPVIQ